MNILFLIYHGFSHASGITKKIQYQIKGFREEGHEVHICTYDIKDNGHRVRFINNTEIQDFGTGKLASLKKRISYQSIYNYAIENKIDFVYSRSFHNANPFTINLFRNFKKAGIKSVMEIPTYPYDNEYSGFPLLSRLELRVDKLFRHLLAKQINAIVTFTDDETIFGQRTINISNGVDFDQIKLKKTRQNTDSTVHLIGVAEVHYWHGFDRLIQGLGEYYKKTHEKQVYFHIVGGVGPSEMYHSKHARGFSELIREYKLENNVVFHGQLFGEQLDEVFQQCDFAIGSLARHRSGIINIKTLKNREYAARGIPFIYSETDTDFDHQPYTLKASADETPVQIQDIIDFQAKQEINPLEIRNSVLHLSWKEQMKKVINAVFK